MSPILPVSVIIFSDALFRLSTGLEAVEKGVEYSDEKAVQKCQQPRLWNAYCESISLALFPLYFARMSCEVKRLSTASLNVFDFRRAGVQRARRF